MTAGAGPSARVLRYVGVPRRTHRPFTLELGGIAAYLECHDVTPRQ